VHFLSHLGSPKARGGFVVKTVRFAQVVKSAGNPDVHLLLTDPRLDSVLQKAVKSGRVMTLHQSVIGNKADFGTVGLVQGVKGQILIFPRSLAAFEGKNVVGVKYELLAERPQGRTKPAPKIAKPKLQTQMKPPLRTKIVPFPHPNIEGEDEEQIAGVRKELHRAIRALAAGKQILAYNLLQSLLRTLN
jgi:hypothetical protein